MTYGTFALERPGERARKTCVYCPRLCHFVCPAATAEGSVTASPWGMVSLVDALAERRIAWTRENVEPLYHCTSCGRCTAFCAHGNPVAEILLAARHEAVERGCVPVEVERWVLDQASHADAHRVLGQGDGDATAPVPDEDAFGWFPGCSLEDDALRRGIASVLEHVLGRKAVQLGGDAPACCGGAAFRAGYADIAKAQMEQAHHRIGGRERWVTGCNTLVKSASTEAGMTEDHRPQAWWTLLATHADRLPKPARRKPMRVWWHAACDAGLDPAALAPLLDALDVIALPLPAWDGLPECCGADPLYRVVAPEGAQDAARWLARAWEGREGEVDAIVSSSARCAAHISLALGRPILSLADLVVTRCGTQKRRRSSSTRQPKAGV